jgi:predicted GNAT superfamily acetyltransferase
VRINADHKRDTALVNSSPITRLEARHYAVIGPLMTLAAELRTGYSDMTIETVKLAPVKTVNAGIVSALLDLNNANKTELSFLDEEGFQHLLNQSYLATCVGWTKAFLISLDQDADYGGVNFCWFRDRYDRFIYIDRIVVAPEARGRGIAKALYENLIDYARRDGHEQIVCEVNSEPPNPGSDAFHASFGFQAVGEATIHAGTKTVRYLCLSLEPPAKRNLQRGRVAVSVVKRRLPF